MPANVSDATDSCCWVLWCCIVNTLLCPPLSLLVFFSKQGIGLIRQDAAGRERPGGCRVGCDGDEIQGHALVGTDEFEFASAALHREFLKTVCHGRVERPDVRTRMN